MALHANNPTGADANTTPNVPLASVASSGGGGGASGAGDTVCAVGSPPGRSTRGLVRVSGPATLNGFAALGIHLSTPRTLTPVRVALPGVGGGTGGSQGGHGGIELPALAWYAEGPNTYTGETCGEVLCVGQPWLLQKVVEALCAVTPASHAPIDTTNGSPTKPETLTSGGGIRLAEAGEFTFRAYTNGRLDLTQAEGVAATISAVSDAQLAAAKHLQDGELGRFAQGLVDRVATLLALVEAGIDFVDQEDVVPIKPDDLIAGLKRVRADLAELLDNSRSWSTLDGLPRVVMVGPPSAGKSTLFNALLGQTRAVIDAAPGTTRDAIEAPLVMDTPTGPAEVMLVDIAGLDQVSTERSDALSHIERMAQDQAQKAIDQADFVLQVGPAGCPATEGLDLSGKPVLRVWTKADLTDATVAEEGHPADQVNALTDSGGRGLGVSAVTGVGMAALRGALAEALVNQAVSLRGEQMALQPRHEADLHAALEGVDAALMDLAWSEGQASIDDVELVAGAMRAALDALAALGGQMTPDDVIGRVFATFCVGK